MSPFVETLIKPDSGNSSDTYQWIEYRRATVEDPERTWPSSLAGASFDVERRAVQRRFAGLLVGAGDRLVRTGQTLMRSAGPEGA